MRRSNADECCIVRAKLLGLPVEGQVRVPFDDIDEFLVGVNVRIDRAGGRKFTGAEAGVNSADGSVDV
jgi:hypothetical protein